MDRDSTQDWLVPEESRPPLWSELEARVDEAVTIARASEAAIEVFGNAAIEAAKQACRAAELAEQASIAVVAGSAAANGGDPTAPEGAPVDPSLGAFRDHADRVMARLMALEGSAANGSPAPIAVAAGGRSGY